MKAYFTILLALLSFQYLSAQTQEETKPKTQEEIKNQVIEQLFNTREQNEFIQASNTAKKLGLNQQVILEATFLYHIDRAESEKIIKLTEKFQQLADKFDPNISKIFTTKEDWLSVIEYGLALKALDKNNITLFKKHIKEAFWLSPNKAAAFAPHINQLHTNQAMEKIQLNLDRQIFQINSNKTISLKKLLENKEALVLRFWSPWCQQIELNYPLTKQLATRCNNNQISFASILISKDPQAIKDTLEIIEELGNDLSSYWLADEDTSALTKLLRVEDLPIIVIISKTGEILFNGTLQDKKLHSAIKKIELKTKIK